MAQSRTLSMILRYEEILTDLQEVDKATSKLLKDATQFKKKVLKSKAKSEAAKNKINIEDIESILLELQKLDDQNLRIQQVLHKSYHLSYHIQQQLELRNIFQSHQMIKGNSKIGTDYIDGPTI